MRTLCAGVALSLALACASSPPAPADLLRYRLANSGKDWQVAGSDYVLDDLRPRYAAFFDVVLDPKKTEEVDLRALRSDLEHEPVDRRNYDALNAVAIGYFELNSRAEGTRGGSTYLASSFGAAKLVAVPWRAYGEIQDGRLRDAILDFFADVANGEKRRSRRTAARLVQIVSSLEKKEENPVRLERIQSIAERLSGSVSVR